jgi:uncharacterized BrkB/YihY/UPF0761 family membrane protein
VGRILHFILLTAATIALLFFTWIFCAAFSDYDFELCPDANQCEGAKIAMYFSGTIVLGLLTTFAAVLYFKYRRKCRRPDESRDPLQTLK